jgi:hypothetical protein
LAQSSRRYDRQSRPPGSSAQPAAEGGALIDAHGRVVGMLVLGPRRRVLAIPASTISRTEAVTRAAQLYSFGEGSLVTILGA